MTQPVSHGFPDWGRQLAASDIVIQNSLGLNLTALTQTAVYFVGNMPYMYIRLSSVAQAQVSIAWFADAAATISLFGDVMVTPLGSEATQCVPVRGPYVRFALERSAYPGTVNFQAIMVSTPFDVYAGTSGENVLISVRGQAVPGLTVVTSDAVATRWGWIYWKADYEAAGLYRHELFAVDFSGALHMLDFISNANRAASGRVLPAPALPLRVISLNGDAAPNNLWVSVEHYMQP